MGAFGGVGAFGLGSQNGMAGSCARVVVRDAWQHVPRGWSVGFREGLLVRPQTCECQRLPRRALRVLVRLAVHRRLLGARRGWLVGSGWLIHTYAYTRSYIQPPPPKSAAARMKYVMMARGQ